MTEKVEKERVTVSEAEKILGASESQIRKLVAAGQLEAIDVRLPDKRRASIRISMESIREFVERRSVPPIEA